VAHFRPLQVAQFHPPRYAHFNPLWVAQYSRFLQQYFENEIKPHVPDAWIDFDKTRIGYEINFTKYFYEYKGLRPAAEIKAEIVDLEKDIAELLNDLLV